MNQYTFITKKSIREGACYGVVVCKDREAVYEFAQNMVEQEGWEFHKQSWTLHKEGCASLRLLTEEMAQSKWGMLQGMHIVCAFVLEDVDMWSIMGMLFARMRHPTEVVDCCIYTVYDTGVHKLIKDWEMWK